MITLDEVANLIRREMRGKAAADVTIDENTVLTDIGLSSLQIAEVIFTLEESYDVEFDSVHAADVKTLRDLVALGNEALQARTN